MPDPRTVFTRLREQVFRYYGTPYRLRVPEVEAERLALLDRDGATWREPWIEAIADYELTGDGFATALDVIEAPAELARFASCGLIEYPDIFKHQRDALRDSRAGYNVAITAGTGSGKTESFLLPVVSALIEESASWTGTSPIGDQWWDTGGSWTPQRADEHGRMPGIRTLILYPMNALVEDQLVRLRRALDSQGARAWLDDNRGGHRYYFGRYTGGTPVSGSPQQHQCCRTLQVIPQRRHTTIPATQGRRRAPIFYSQDGRRRDARALGYAASPSRHSHHKLLHAQHRIAPRC